MNNETMRIKKCEYHGRTIHTVDYSPAYVHDDGSVTEWDTYWDCTECEWERKHHADLVFGKDLH